MSALSLRLPNSLHKQLRELARKDGVSINQLVNSAVAEKMAALMVDYLRARAKRGSREKFEAALAKVPDVEPQEEDRLPGKALPTRHTQTGPVFGRTNQPESWRAVRRVTMLSNTRSATRISARRSSSRMPVGLVTLSSVMKSPMTSIPENSSPFSRSTGPTWSQIHRSRSVSGLTSTGAPVDRLPRWSPAGGIRTRAIGIGRPSISMNRLSPELSISERYFRTMTKC